MQPIQNQRVARVNKIIGKQGMLHGNKDSDGDGVRNVMDCEPYNKHKQGMIHNLVAKGAEIVGAKDTAQRVRLKGQYADEESDKRKMERRETQAREENIQRDAKKEGDQAYYEKKKEVAIKNAKAQAVARAEQPSTSSRIGGFVKTFIDQPNKKGYVTKKKKATMPNVFGSKPSGNSAQIPNLFGANKGKEKEYKMPKIF